MCNNCQQSNCSCSNSPFSYNWYNAGQSCDPCSNTKRCKTIIPSECVQYNAVILDSLNLSATEKLETIILRINSELLVLQQQQTENKTTILAQAATIIDLTARIVALEA